MPKINFDKLFVAPKLKGQKWLTRLALLALEHGKELEYDDHNPHLPPQIIIRDPSTERWLAHEETAEEEQITNTIVNFDREYAALEPEINNPGGDDEWNDDDDIDESLPKRIVDVLLEDDVEDLVNSFSQSQEVEGGNPIDPTPSGKRIIRAVKLDSGHLLYLWRTDKNREYYGQGLAARFLGYRFVAPDGTILFQGDGFHPGAVKDPTGNDVLADLLSSLTTKPGDTDDEYFEKYTPAQLAWAESNDAECYSGVGEDVREGIPPPWKDLPGYEYNRRRQ